MKSSGRKLSELFNLRASSNGRIPVSKTVDLGSNPSARAKLKYELIS